MSSDRQSPNPYTGQNGRGFQEGVYLHVAVKQRVNEDVRKALNPDYSLDFMDFWYDAQSVDNAQIKLVVSKDGVTTTRYITVPDNGFRGPWAGMVGPTLVAYVKAEFSDS